MLADGLKKGTVDREALQIAVLEGTWKIEHAVRIHPSQMPDAKHSQGQPELKGSSPVSHPAHVTSARLPSRMPLQSRDI